MSDPPPPSTSPAEPVTTGYAASTPPTVIDAASQDPAAPAASVLALGPGRYRLGAEIGRGGMGSVLRGHDPDLKRDLAIKVLLESQRDQPEVVRRFFEEAQIAGQLQHPGVVPVHELGVLPDGRPFFAMKLVEGRTLAELLKERTSPSDKLPHFLHVFEQVCQAVGYAHSRGVIHRDLKPSNVMVGAFGEVQVMDWGLAKVLDPASRERQRSEQEHPSTDSVVTIRQESGDVSQSGMVLGTAAFMPPEQARGAVEELDERADVFSLGAILCQILTGQPPYVAPDTQALLNKATRGDLNDAFRRLKRCGADAEVIALARSCLAADPRQRPRDAGAVGTRVAAYRTGVQERLRAVETERAAALARAEAEERKRRAERRARRLTLGLAGVVVAALLAAAGGAVWAVNYRAERRRAEALREAQLEREEALRQVEARNRADRARQEAESDLREADDKQRQGQWIEVDKLLRHAEGRLADGDFPDLRDRIDQSRRNLALVGKLDDVRLGKVSITEGKIDNDSALRNYPRVLSEYGFDVLQGDPEQAAARIRTSPLREPLLAALDDWATTPGANRDDVRRLLDVAGRADDNERRRQCRELWRQGRTAELAGLAETIDPAQWSPTSLRVLAGQLTDQHQAAFRVLWRGQMRYADDFWLNVDLAVVYHLRYRRYDEAVGYFRAALALRPRSEAIWNNLGVALYDQKKMPEAHAAFNEAIRLRPDYANARYNLGNVLRHLKRLPEAETQYREAIRLKPEHVEARNNLASFLLDRKKLPEAEAELRAALRVRPNFFEARCNLGRLFREQKKLPESEDELRAAVRSQPDSPEGHYQLGMTLYERKDWAQAEAEMCQAIRLRPDHLGAHGNLGQVLAEQKKYARALAAFAEAVQILQANPALSDPEQMLRYNAACCAVLIAAGKDVETGQPTEPERTRWHGQARGWLRDDLAVWTKRLDGGQREDRALLEKRMRYLQADEDLVSVRDPDALAKLSDAERAEWEKLWRDVEALRKRAAEPK
jgi:serine/threonine-protein kinase